MSTETDGRLSKPTMEKILDWWGSMQTSTNYLRMEDLKPGMAYSIWARNAYVGVWVPEEQGFLISRYKCSPEPYLFIEYHWDTGEPYGTVKPLRPLEICPLPLPPQSSYLDQNDNEDLCAWLDALETRHPPFAGWDTIKARRESGAIWIRKQEIKRRMKNALNGKN